MAKMRNPTICPKCAFNLSEEAYFNTPTTRLPWGEHRGKTIRWIIKYHPRWVQFCLKELGGFELNNKAMKLLNKRLEKMI